MRVFIADAPSSRGAPADLLQEVPGVQLIGERTRVPKLSVPSWT